MKNNFFISKFAKSSKFQWDFLRKIESYENWNDLAIAYDKFLDFKENKKNESIPRLIPKKIHQIWIGKNKIPHQYKVWMRSWKEYNPEWEYIFWDEDMINNFSLKNKDLFETIENPGFKSDIARYEILNRFGGIYVDTDFECLKKIPDYLLNYEFITSVGFDYSPVLFNGMIFSKPNSFILKKLINEISKPNINSNPNEIMKSSGPYAFTKNFFNLSQKEKDNSIILPTNMFYPYPNFALSIK